jgi:aspartyl protease family protein
VSDVQPVDILWYLGALVLVLSALTARRLSLGAVLRSLLAWLVIGGIAWALIARRDQVEQLVTAAADRFGVGEQTVVGETVRIAMGPDGHFWARAVINGKQKRLLIDSGATITALSEDTAGMVGVEASESGFPVVLRTANGAIAAKRGTIERIEVGSLAMTDLGVVVSSAFGDVDVLGMNFLSRLGSWRVEGRTLILEPPAARNKS